jgi:hypothetical protein
LIVVLVAACSYDIGKLRAPVSPPRDGAVELSGGLDVTAMSGDTTDDLAVTSGADGAEVVPEVSGDGKPVVPDAISDLSALDVAEDVTVLADGADGADLPLANADGGDAFVESDGGGSGGAGGSGGGGGTGGGAGGVALDGGAGTGGMDADAAGGTGGTDANGTGGADGGGSDGKGGTGGTGDAGGTGGTGIDPDLVLWYKFDESSGKVAADSSPWATGTYDGTLGTAGMGGSATFTADCQVGTHALSLVPSSAGSTSAGGYVTLPSPVSLAPGAITIAVWVKLAAATSALNWERIFDFGNGTGSDAPYLYMTARASGVSAPLRFGISNIGHSMPGLQELEGTAGLTANVWHHIAIVLPAGATYTGVLYIDGAVAATNNAMTLHLSDVRTTTQNWLGRSPFSQDPFFYGSLDDFRIYRRALSAAEITALMALR